MKKLLLICAMVVCGIGQVHAQLEEDDFGFFNHVALGVSAGTDGIGVQLAAPLTSSFAVRAGYSFMPKFKYKKDINVGKDPAFLSYPNDQHVDLEGKLNMSDFSLLFDYYPSMYSSFRLTAGAYIGKSKPLSITNADAFLERSSWGSKGLELGTAGNDYTVVSDKATGNVQADLKVNSFKPYIGIGFGRAVPKGRVSVQFDLGIQIWGTPEVWTTINTFDDNAGDWVTSYRKVNKNRITNPNEDYQDARDAIKTIEKIGVYPVLSLRINGRLF